MANQEVTLMKGNEAIAHACIRCGADGFSAILSHLRVRL